MGASRRFSKRKAGPFAGERLSAIDWLGLNRAAWGIETGLHANARMPNQFSIFNSAARESERL
jgi:hypothetical protein